MSGAFFVISAVANAPHASGILAFKSKAAAEGFAKAGARVLDYNGLLRSCRPDRHHGLLNKCRRGIFGPRNYVKISLVMEETGFVIRLDGLNAVVSVARKSACSHCTSGVCLAGSGQEMEIEALNEAGAVVGERVRVRMREHAYVTGSLILYGVPALALVAGAVLGKELLSSRFPGTDPQGVTAGAAFAGLALGIGVAWLAERLMRRGQGGRKAVAVIEAVIEDGKSTS